MPTFVIPITYMMYGKYSIDADSLLDALEQIQNLPLPEESTFLDDSVNVIEEDVLENNDCILTEGDKEDLSEWIAEDYRQRFD